jgi:hypothetical protein
MDAQTTAEAITWVDYAGVLIYFPLCMLGLMLHFLKKKIKTESFIEVRQYFTTHRVSTLVSVLSSLVVLYIFDAMGQLNVVAAIMAGYSADSLLQKQVDAMVMRNPDVLNTGTGTGGAPGPPPPTTDGPPVEFPSDIISNNSDNPDEGA